MSFCFFIVLSLPYAFLDPMFTHLNQFGTSLNYSFLPIPFFPLKKLVRCNLHTIKFICLMCKIQKFLVYSQSRVTDTMHSRILSLCPICTHLQALPTSPPPNPCQPLISFLFSTDMHILDISYEGNHMTCDL